MSATATAVAPAVALTDVTRAFEPGVPTLNGVSLTIPAGELVALVGPSGCGKSTLLRIIAGLDRADSGKVHVEARERAETIAYVFQDAHLLPWKSVADNVALPLILRHVDRAERDARVKTALAEVGLSDARDRLPAELSGGMRMRASIARALVTRPKLLLMDEPFAALDEITRQRLDERLRALQRAQGFTLLFVTHSIFEATFLATRAIIFSKRPATIVHDGAIDLPLDRDSDLRASPEFAREAGILMKALQRASGPEDER